MKHAKKVLVAWFVALSIALPGPVLAFNTQPILKILIKKFFRDGGEQADRLMPFVHSSGQSRWHLHMKLHHDECDPIYYGDYAKIGEDCPWPDDPVRLACEEFETLSGLGLVLDLWGDCRYRENYHANK